MALSDVCLSAVYSIEMQVRGVCDGVYFSMPIATAAPVIVLHFDSEVTKQIQNPLLGL
jgi:hypothetical protein